MVRNIMLAFGIAIVRLVVASGCQRDFTQPQIIKSPNYPETYLVNSNCTWVWFKPKGVWAVLFEDLDIDCLEYVYIIIANKKLPMGCNHDTQNPTYTPGSHLTIRFISLKKVNYGRGFKLRILSGRNQDDLKGQVYDLKRLQKKDEGEDHVHILLYVLLIFAVLLVLFVALWIGIFKRRRRQSDRSVSIAVSVNHIRRDSGVSYKRPPSESTESKNTSTTTTKVEIDRRHLTRTPSQRSWTTRAALVTKGSEAVDNVYSPMHYQNQINRPLSALIEYDPLSKPVPNAARHPTTISGYEAPVIPDYLTNAV